MKKTLILFSIGASLVFAFSFVGSVSAACQRHNVWGWAWAENIGWISFSCKNTEAAVDYGVDITSSNKLIGYAWSDGIGWISFNRIETGAPSENDPCPDGTCIAKVDSNCPSGKCQVSGWARALSPIGKPLEKTGGWDGWIRLNGKVRNGPNYGVWMDTNSSPAEFQEWGWGGNITNGDWLRKAIIGWISFNCQDRNICSVSDYKVFTDYNVNPPSPPPPPPPPGGNEPPSVGVMRNVGSGECPINRDGTGHVGLEWTYLDQDADSQAEYQLQVSTDQGFSNIVVDYNALQSVLDGAKGTSGVELVEADSDPDDLKIEYLASPSNRYYWRVKVRARTGNQDWSEWSRTDSFDTASHPGPYPIFNWTLSRQRALMIPNVGEIIKFDPAGTITFGAGVQDYSWEVGTGAGSQFRNRTNDNDFVDFANGTSKDSQKPEIKFLYAGRKTVRLDVTDTDNITCQTSEFIDVGFVPWWLEIKP